VHILYDHPTALVCNYRTGEENRETNDATIIIEGTRASLYSKYSLTVIDRRTKSGALRRAWQFVKVTWKWNVDGIVGAGEVLKLIA